MNTPEAVIFQTIFSSHACPHPWFSSSPPKLLAIECLPSTGYLEHAEIYLSQFFWICLTVKELTDYTPNSKYSSDCGILGKRFRASCLSPSNCCTCAVLLQWSMAVNFLFAQAAMDVWKFPCHNLTISFSVFFFSVFFELQTTFIFSFMTWLIKFRVLSISIPVSNNYSRIGKPICLWIKYFECFFLFPLFFFFFGEIFCPVLSNPFIRHHPFFLFGSVFIRCKLKCKFWEDN